MVVINDYVKKIETPEPTGIVNELRAANTVALVRWGVADGHIYTEEVPVADLIVVTEKIWTPDEIVKRQAEEAGGKFKDDITNGQNS